MAGDDFAAYVLDCLNAARLGAVQRERLFGGSGLRLDGALFGVILRGTLYFVVDDQTRPRFVEAGMGPFTYARKTETRVIPRWYELPEDVLLDPAELRDWVQAALGAVRRTAKPAKTKPAVKKPAAKKAVVKTPAEKKIGAPKTGAPKSGAKKPAAKAKAKAKPKKARPRR